MNNIYRKNILLERYLNKFRYNGIPLGGAIADQLILTSTNGVPKAKQIFTILLSDAYYIAINILKKTNLISFKKVLVTRISDKTHLRNMMLPIIKYYNGDITIIVNNNIDKKIIKTHHISIKETYNTPLRLLMHIFNLSFFVFISLYRKKNRLKLRTIESIFFSSFLFHQLRILSFYDYQFRNKHNNPKVVIVEFDRNNITSPLILAANKHKITTVTLVHGVINSYGYSPVLADKIFCFGEIQKQQLLKQGVPENKILITGTSIIDYDLNSDITVIKAHIPFTVCLGISPVGKDKIKYFIDECVKVITKRDDVKLLIKLHPSQRFEDYKHYETENIQVLSSTIVKNIDLFSKIDLLIIYNSGLGVEAAMAGVPVAIFDIPELDMGMGKIMIDEGGFSLLRNSNEINSYIDSLLLQTNYLKEKNASKEFARNFYFLTGKAAADKIISEIKMILDTNKLS